MVPPIDITATSKAFSLSHTTTSTKFRWLFPNTPSSKALVNSTGFPKGCQNITASKAWRDFSASGRVNHLFGGFWKHTHTHTPNFPDRLLWLKDSLCAHRVDQVVLYNRYLQKISLRAINPYKFSPLHLASKQHFEDSLLY